MLEYLIIFVIVALAVWFSARHLWREARSGKCSDCYCGAKKNSAPQLIQIISPESKKTE